MINPTLAPGAFARSERPNAPLFLTFQRPAAGRAFRTVKGEISMSSALRSIQKRILKKQGFTRQTKRVELLNGQPRIVHLKKGTGPILNPDGDPIGFRYPKRLPASGPDKQSRRKGAPRGSRRGKRNPGRFVSKREAV